MLPARTADPGEVQTITHRHHTLADRPGEASIRPVTGGLLAAVFAPVMQVWLGLPAGATAALLVGFLRKDLAVGMLVPLGMTPEQLVIAVTMLTVYQTSSPTAIQGYFSRGYLPSIDSRTNCSLDAAARRPL